MSWAATICQRLERLTRTSVHTYFPILPSLRFPMVAAPSYGGITNEANPQFIEVLVLHFGILGLVLSDYVGLGIALAVLVGTQKIVGEDSLLYAFTCRVSLRPITF